MISPPFLAQGSEDAIGSQVVWMLWLTVFLSIFLVPAYYSRLFILGVGWAPMAAVVCWMIARRKGLSTRRFAVMGGVFSVLLLFPWVYIVLRMVNLRVPQLLVILFYVTVYASWAINLFWAFQYPDHAVGMERVAIWIWALVSATGFLASLGWLLIKYESPPSPRATRNPAWSERMPELRHLIPFMLLAVSSAPSIWGQLGMLYEFFL